MDPDYHDASYEGTYLSVLMEGLDPLLRWDRGDSLDPDCLGGAQHVMSAAKALCAHLSAMKSSVSSDADVVSLTTDQSKPWAPFVDPALSTVLPAVEAVCIALWECSDHVAAVAGWGPTWSDVAYGDSALLLIQTMRMKTGPFQPIPVLIDDASGDVGGDSAHSPERRNVDRATPIEDELGPLAETWLRAGYSLEEALPWARAGLLPLHADRWRGWDVSTAVDLALRALRPERVTAWQLAHPGESAADWVRAGIGLDTAEAWLDLSIDLEAARGYIARGLTEPRYLADGAARDL